MSHDEAINVVLRCRGRLERENAMVTPNIVFLDPKDPILTISIPEQRTQSSSQDSPRSSIVLNQVANVNRTYKLDHMFGAGADQVSIFNKVALDMCDDFLKGYNCTIFAYGQTGSGKTHTMFGDEIEMGITQKSGIIPRCLSKLFQKVKDETILKCSFIEIYNEELRDLLNPSDSDKNLKIYEQQAGDSKMIKIKGLEEFIIKDQTQGFKYLQLGMNKRETQFTKMNSNSSRSHTIFTIHMIKKIDGKDYQLAKFNLVDLAGSENIRKSGSTNQRAKEAGSINQSLLTLGKVINALSDKSKFIPYRESKLTRILKDSLGGDTKTTLIATISPTLLDLHSTISTLDYAAKAKNIQNTVQIGSIIKDQMIMSDLIDENRRLQMDLMATRRREGHIYLDLDNYTESILSNKILQSQVDELKLKNETLELRFNEVNESKVKEVGDLKQSLNQMEMKIVSLNNELNDQMKTGDKLKEVNYQIGSDLINDIEDIESQRRLVDKKHYDAIRECFLLIRDKINDIPTEINNSDDGHDKVLSKLIEIEENELKIFDYLKTINSHLRKFKPVDVDNKKVEIDQIVELIHENNDELRKSNLKNDPIGCKDEIEESISPTIEEFKSKIIESIGKFSDKLFNETLKSTQKIYFEPISESYINSQNFNNDLSRRLSSHRSGLVKLSDAVSANESSVVESSKVVEHVLNDHATEWRTSIDESKDEVSQLRERNDAKSQEETERIEFMRTKVDEIFDEFESQKMSNSTELVNLKERVQDILIGKNKMESLSPSKKSRFSMVTMRSPSKRQKLT